jgi:hypothetical protein
MKGGIRGTGDLSARNMLAFKPPAQIRKNTDTELSVIFTFRHRCAPIKSLNLLKTGATPSGTDIADDTPGVGRLHQDDASSGLDGDGSRPAPTPGDLQKRAAIQHIRIAVSLERKQIAPAGSRAPPTP